MIIPKELNILGHTVKVLYPYIFKERSDLNGQYSDETKEIRISDKSSIDIKLADSVIAVIFLHEILHAIDFITGHNIFCSESGEKVLEGLSNGLYQVLKDNKLSF